MNTITSALAAEIATHLGSNWQLKQPESDTARWFSIIRNDGLTISVGSYANKPAMASFRALEVVDALGETISYPRYIESKPFINFSATKGAKAIAADIIRRLIPDAEKQFTLALEQKANHDDYCNRIRQNYAALVSFGSETLEVKPRYANNGDKPDFHTLNLKYTANRVGYGDITITDKDCKVVLPALPVELVGKLLSTVSDYLKEKHDQSHRSSIGD